MFTCSVVCLPVALYCKRDISHTCLTVQLSTVQHFQRLQQCGHSGQLYDYTLSKTAQKQRQAVTITHMVCYSRVGGVRIFVSSPSILKQTTTRDFTCSVSEFTSSTGSIHGFSYVNSPDSVNKFGVSTHVYCEITSFSRDDTCQ